MRTSKHTLSWELEIKEKQKAEREAIAHMLETFLQFYEPGGMGFNRPSWLPPFMEELAQMIREGKHHESIWAAK